MVRKMGAPQGSGKKKPAPINGPFELVPVGTDRRWGYCDQATIAPLGVDALGTDGQPPHGPDGASIPMKVRWTVVDVPDGAMENLISGTLKSKLTPIDANGRAYVSFQLGKVQGLYTISATLVGSPGSANALFEAYTEGVVFNLLPEQIVPTPVDKAMKVVVYAQDWTGRRISNARIATAILGTDDDLPPIESKDVEAKGGRGGRYWFYIRYENAGPQDLSIGDAVTGVDHIYGVQFLPGRLKSLELVQVPTKQFGAPEGQVRVSLLALDGFGNLIPTPSASWETSDATVRPTVAGVEESAAAMIDILPGQTAKVVARVGRRVARIKVQNPSVILVPSEQSSFSFTGDTFRLSLFVAAPTGGGTLEGYRIRIQEPVKYAERIGFRCINPDNGIAEPEVCDLGKGVIELLNEGMSVPLPKKGGGILLGEFEYACLCAEQACFEISEAVLSIARSPGEEYVLNPGVDFCRPQKVRARKTLCLRICIAAKPKAGKTPQQVFDAIKDDIEDQVEQAQQILNDNVEICCPIIQIEAEYQSIPWNQYQAIVAGGDKPGSMEVLPGPWENVGAEGNAQKDVFGPNDKLKQLLKKCRKDNCIPIYYVPKMQLKKGGRWKKLDGVTVSPNDYPETTAAEGSGVGIVLHQGLPTRKNSLIHELGHMLIDLPRSENTGVEHVGNRGAARNRVMKTNPPHGSKFTKNECSRIFDNIDSYGG